MLHLFQWLYTYVHLYFLDVCYKYLDVTYVSHICHTCFIWMLRMLAMIFKCFQEPFLSILERCFKCFIYLFSYIVSVVSEYFKNRSRECSECSGSSYDWWDFQRYFWTPRWSVATDRPRSSQQHEAALLQVPPARGPRVGRLKWHGSRLEVNPEVRALRVK
jgi:hypothetical protein